MAKEENVILLAMSTFPPKMDLNCYHMKTESIECYFNGISQLEAGTKYFHLCGWIFQNSMVGL